MVTETSGLGIKRTKYNKTSIFTWLKISSFSNKDFEALVQEFASLLEFATKDKALLISLDGLDELSEEYGADLSWIPTKLPENVYFMVSTSTESNCSCLKALKVKYCLSIKEHDVC